jgi:hypothetical protein
LAQAEIDMLQLQCVEDGYFEVDYYIYPKPKRENDPYVPALQQIIDVDADIPF